MSEKLFLSSVSRIAPFDRTPPGLVRRSRSQWCAGDFVVVELLETTRAQEVELTNGRIAHAYSGARILGALAERAATLESVGSWRAVGEDGALNLMTPAGLVGLITSRSALMLPAIPARYVAHATLGGEPVGMRDFVPEPSGDRLAKPVILIIGTSMSSGKTVSGQRVVRLLKKRGLKVVGAKLTGAGRYRDVLSLADAGADSIFDFVDGGIPSSICEVDEYRRALGVVFDLISAEKPDVVVAEAGASPLEPYNGMTAIEELGDLVGFTVLAASDPYAVSGVMSAFGTRPDVVAGVATSTSAGIELIEKLTGVPAVNVLRSDDDAELDRMLAAKLDL